MKSQARKSTTSHAKVALVAAALAFGVGVGGCSLSDSDSGNHGSGNVNKDPYNYGGYGTGGYGSGSGGYGSGGKYDPTAAEGKYKDVPKGVPIVRDDKGVVNWTAPDSGRIYITEGGTNNLLFQSRVKKGDTISIDPKRKRINFNGSDIRTEMDPEFKHRIFFDAGERLSL